MKIQYAPFLSPFFRVGLGLVAVMGCFLPPDISIAETVAPPDWERLSGPHTAKNLTIYLVHGADKLNTESMIALDHAIEQKLIRVHETGNVNELQVENLSSDKTIFIQAGDIVKGGKQDRTLSSDLILKPKSGKVSLEAFCVEQSRWQARGSEPVQQFHAAKERVASKKMKLAASFEKRQDKVWEEVAVTQRKLSASVGKPVAAPASSTSLQLSLEDVEVKRKVEEYRTELEKLIDSSPDAIGYVFLVNGQINSADVYASHVLFKMVWPRLLSAAANEAVAESGQVVTGPVADIGAAEGLLRSLDKAPPTQTAAGSTIREDTKAFASESYAGNGAKKQWLHRAYVTK